jgi:hypothetical protein
MEWRIGLALVFLLVLLFSVLHLAYSTIPPVRSLPPDVGDLPDRGPISPEYGRMGYATMNNFRPMDETFKRVSPAFKFTMDASGNVIYPH